MPRLIFLLVALLVSSFLRTGAQSTRPAATPAVVYEVHNSAAIEHYRTNPAIVRSMVDTLVLAVTHQPEIGRAWASLVSPSDRIGIKISGAGGELFTTHRDVVNAIVDGLVAAGHIRSSIIVWDRSLGGVKEAGYNPGVDGYQIKSIAPRDGYDAKAIFSAPFMGNLIWGDFEYTHGWEMPLLSDTENVSSVSHFSRIVSNEVTKIINVPVLSDSVTNGIAGCLYNATIPNVDNWRRFTQPPNYGASSIPEIYSDPRIGRKVVLNLMDGLVAQYAGGPQSQPNFSLHFATLYAGKDPVAIDAVALRHLEEWRTRSKLAPIGRLAGHVWVAARLGLGNLSSDRIEVRNVGH